MNTTIALNVVRADTLMALSGSSLDRAILYLIKASSTGKPWACVTVEEAKTMIAHGDALNEAFRDEGEPPFQVRDIIDDGRLAEGLLFGYLDVDGDQGETICVDCRAGANDLASGVGSVPDEQGRRYTPISHSDIGTDHE